MKLLKKYQHVWIVPVYGIFYLWAFQYLEQRNVKAHIIHLKLDDMIPFCEYFIIPYLMWFLYIALTVGYFAFINKNKQEYYQLILFLSKWSGFKTTLNRRRIFYQFGTASVPD